MKAKLISWPKWPQYDKCTLDAASIALMAGRWAISGPTTIFALYEKIFAEEFASLIGLKYCVPCSNGSNAIVIALQALGIGPGDRVLLPAGTWVGCSTAILRVGATPIFIDSELDSLCMDFDSLAGVESNDFSAILAIHTYASRMDITKVRKRFPGIPIIEDCSHCHGAGLPDGRKYGSFGDISVFSFQASKLLTCGEGGAALTDDEGLYNKLLVLRADSRRYRLVKPHSIAISLEPGESLHGANYCMSELHASILLQQMELLEQRNNLRAKQLKQFCLNLEGLPINIISDEGALSDGAFYGLPVRLPNTIFKNMSIEQILNEINQRCGLYCDRIHMPIPESPLYRPKTIGLYSKGIKNAQAELYPRAAKAHSSIVLVPHHAFLANTQLIQMLSDVFSSLVDRPNHTHFVFPALAENENFPDVTVIVLSEGRYDMVLRAIFSILKQDYKGKINILLVGYNCQYIEVISSIEELLCSNILVMNLRGNLFHGVSEMERIARMRNLALSQTESELVSFLDDDNRWSPNHLSSLFEKMLETGCPAVHSWRVLVNRDNQPFVVKTFPWLQNECEARQRFKILVELEMMSTDSPIVRDRHFALYGGVDYGMVDCGEWLFRRSILQVLGFRTDYSAMDKVNMIGEDDKLLLELKRRRIPISSTERPTLYYTMGGMSNRFYDISIN